MEKVHVIRLFPKERNRLIKVVSVGKNKAAVIRRAHILLKSNEGKTDKEIAEFLYVSEETVRRTRQRFCEAGLEMTLNGKPYPPKERKLNTKQEAYLVALACSEPPDGRARWTIELLTAQLIGDGVVDSISPEAVRLVLKKTNSSLGE